LKSSGSGQVGGKEIRRVREVWTGSSAADRSMEKEEKWKCPLELAAEVSRDLDEIRLSGQGRQKLASKEGRRDNECRSTQKVGCGRRKREATRKGKEWVVSTEVIVFFFFFFL
jgi:hypothetical protein